MPPFVICLVFISYTYILLYVAKQNFKISTSEYLRCALKCAISRLNNQKFSGEGAQPPPQTTSPADTPSPHPPRPPKLKSCLRHCRRSKNMQLYRHNFGKCWPIFKILSLLASAINWHHEWWSFIYFQTWPMKHWCKHARNKRSTQIDKADNWNRPIIGRDDKWEYDKLEASTRITGRYWQGMYLDCKNGIAK